MNCLSLVFQSSRWCNSHIGWVESPLEIQPSSSTYTEQTKWKPNSCWKFAKAKTHSVFFFFTNLKWLTVDSPVDLEYVHTKSVILVGENNTIPTAQKTATTKMLWNYRSRPYSKPTAGAVCLWCEQKTMDSMGASTPPFHLFLYIRTTHCTL